MTAHVVETNAILAMAQANNSNIREGDGGDQR